MSQRAATFTKAAIGRTIAAAKENGCRKIEVYPDKIVISVGEGKSCTIAEKDDWEVVK